MDKFERLNYETRQYNNNRPINRFNSNDKYGTKEYWLNYWNNQTYKTNNGQYSNKYY